MAQRAGENARLGGSAEENIAAMRARPGSEANRVSSAASVSVWRMRRKSSSEKRRRITPSGGGEGDEEAPEASMARGENKSPSSYITLDRYSCLRRRRASPQYAVREVSITSSARRRSIAPGIASAIKSDDARRLRRGLMAAIAWRARSRRKCSASSFRHRKCKYKSIGAQHMAGEAGKNALANRLS